MPRVEPKLDLVGRGMATDPDSIRLLSDEAARKERANAPKPKKPFKKVLREKQQEEP
ncbi:MAG: hypothetical protein V4534_03135 [Myxococcota bacterium]